MLFIIQSMLIGALSTFFMDVVALFRERFFQIKPLNYAFIGRWFLTFKDGKIIHKNITQSSSKKFERAFGWGIHYLTGILWVYLYLILKSIYAFEHLFMSILIFSLCTTLLPLMLIQPALGFGFFAAKTPNPWLGVKNSVIAHVAFGIGLYVFYQLLMPYFTD